VDAHIDESGRQVQVLFLRRCDALAIDGFLAEIAFEPADKVCAERTICNLR